MPGYLVKRKNLWYYKCRKKGCCNNKSAKELHKIFLNILSRFKADEKSLEVMRVYMIRTFNQMNKDNSLLQEQLHSFRTYRRKGATGRAVCTGGNHAGNVLKVSGKIQAGDSRNSAQVATSQFSSVEPRRMR
jgi:hypothetical protein